MRGGRSPSSLPLFPLSPPPPPYLHSSRHSSHVHCHCWLSSPTGSRDQELHGNSTVLDSSTLLLIHGASKAWPTRPPPQTSWPDKILPCHGFHPRYCHLCHTRRHRPFPNHPKHSWLVPFPLNILVILTVGGGGSYTIKETNKQTLSEIRHNGDMMRCAVCIDATFPKSGFSVLVQTRIGCQISHM